MAVVKDAPSLSAQALLSFQVWESSDKHPLPRLMDIAMGVLRPVKGNRQAFPF